MSRNLRKKPRISYYELEEPDLDEYVFCDQCRDYVYEYCSIHGALLVVPDDEVPVPSGFPPCVPRAALTIPQEFLHLAPSIIPGAGIGVFATVTLPRGVRFGPYRGQRTKEAHPDSRYCWQIYSGAGGGGGGRRVRCVVDGRDPDRSNWMRYVNCSRHWLEQNLVAYQYRGELYYRTVKIIPRHTELLVFYGAQFAHALRIRLHLYNTVDGFFSLEVRRNEIDGPATVHTAEKDTSLVSNSNAAAVQNIKNNENSPPENEPNKNTKIVNAHHDKRDTTQTLNPCKVTNNISKLHKTGETLPIPTVNNEHSPPEKESNKNTKVVYARHIKQNTTQKLNACKKTNNISKGQKTSKTLPKITVNNESSLPENESNKTTKTVNARHVKRNTTQKLNTCKKTKNISKVQKTSGTSPIPTMNGENIQVIEDYSCGICEYITTNEDALNSHLIAHAAAERFACDNCLFITINKTELALHIKTHGTANLGLNDSKEKFMRQKNVSVNEHKLDVAKKDNVCDVCHKTFSRKDYFVLHKRIHSGEKLHPCNVCQKNFTIKNDLVRHNRIHTGERPYTCEVCQKRFIQNSDLVKHTRIHTGEKPYTCEVCQESFIQKQHLVYHKTKHTGEKPYACEVCQKRFIQNSDLVKHKRIHTGERPYTCEVCQESFIQKQHLGHHKRIHTGEKPYTCKVCQKKFNLKSDLVKHERIHTGEKPYTCKVCQKNFNRKSDLVIHERIHTGEKPYTCEVCQKRFRNSSHLAKHRRSH